MIIRGSIVTVSVAELKGYGIETNRPRLASCESVVGRGLRNGWRIRVILELGLVIQVFFVFLSLFEFLLLESELLHSLSLQILETFERL